jgi:transposase
VISVEDWARIRQMHFADRLSIRAIERKTGFARNTVRNALRSSKPPRYVREATGSIVDEVEPKIRELLRETPDMPATVIADRIGWEHGMTVLKERVRLLRPLATPPDPASRIVYAPGSVCQNDLWFPAAEIPLGFGQVGFGETAPPVLVCTAGNSRFLAATMIPTKTAEDLVLGQWAVTRQLEAVPGLYVWDNEGGVGRHNGGKPKLTPEFTALRGMLGTRFYVCRPRDPETKGLTERNNGFFETSFLPGRRFSGPADFNAQLAEFLARANARKRRALDGQCALDRVGADRAAMRPLPPIEVADISWRKSVILPRDYYVRLDTCDYSVHPSAIGHRVEVVADLDVVRVRRGQTLVAEHPRCWARRVTVIDPEHRKAADKMRQDYQDWQRERQREQRERRNPPPAGSDVEQRDLSSYDQILGTGDDERAA